MKSLRHLFQPVLLSFLIIAAKPSSAQKAIASRADVSINLAALYSGLPEVGGDFFINRYVGVVASAGYQNKARRGGVKVLENCTVTDAEGAYAKLGLRARFVHKKRNRPIPWLQALYVYSMYDEQGYYEDETTHARDYRHYKGAANGFIVSIGGDFPVYRRLDVRLGFQAGIFYARKDYFGIKANTFQPGIGAEPGLIILGLNYRLGTMKQQTDKKTPRASR